MEETFKQTMQKEQLRLDNVAKKGEGKPIAASPVKQVPLKSGPFGQQPFVSQ